MSDLLSLLIPRWLERAWQETCIDLQASPPSQPAPGEEQETMPLPLPGGGNFRRRK